MNLKDAYLAAVRSKSKIDASRALDISKQSVRSRITAASWEAEFVNFFESLDFEERKFFREIGRYQNLLEAYDICRTEGTASDYVRENVTKIFSSINYYVQVNSQFNDTLEDFHSDDSIEIVFPVRSKESSTFELVDEIDWFFRIFNKVSEELSEEPFRPIVRTVDNVDISISVLVDWKFLLAVLLLWSFIQKRGAETGAVQEALRVLMGRGLAPDEATDLEKKLSKTEDNLIEEARTRYEEVAGDDQPSGWQASFNALARHFLKARERGYNLEFMTKRDHAGKVVSKNEAFIKAVNELSYSRENDRGGAGKVEKIEKSKR